MELRENTTVAIGHIDDAESMATVCATLATLHGPEYAFSVARWTGQTALTAPRGRHRFYFVMDVSGASVTLAPGERVRGVPPVGPYRRLDGQWGEHWGETVGAVDEQLWPGDVVCVDGNLRLPLIVTGEATAFLVESEATSYPLPAVALLRHLTDRPGGCAAYPGAFRREALPPQRAAADAANQRGANRVNEHTLDMRFDRAPQPQPHHHGPVATGGGNLVNHSETALVLPRFTYNLPPVEGTDEGRVIIYPHADRNPTVTTVVPVRPGSVVVTPATTDGVAGHCFENAFAMLVAIPGFVSPHNAMHTPKLLGTGE